MFNLASNQQLKQSSIESGGSPEKLLESDGERMLEAGLFSDSQQSSQNQKVMFKQFMVKNMIGHQQDEIDIPDDLEKQFEVMEHLETFEFPLVKPKEYLSNRNRNSQSFYE